MNDELDLIVVGGGSAGVRCARVAAQLGARAVLVESRDLGGTCVHRGCIPKKLLTYGAGVAHDIEEARGYGWTIEGARHDWPSMIAAKDRETARLGGVYESVVSSAGARIVRGRATLAGGGRVEVDGTTLVAKHVVIAVGGHPRRPAIPGIGLAITSDEALSLPAMPRSMVVVGGGYIGLELASVFRGLGCRVTLLARGGRVLPHFDESISVFVKRELERQGVHVTCGEELTRIEERDGERVAITKSGTEHHAEQVLVAVGREPSTSGLGLERAGVRTGARGEIEVDDHFRTSAAGVYAIGDVIGRLQLTPVALAEGMALARFLFRGAPIDIDYAHAATAVFTRPHVSSVGLTEDAARAAHGEDVVIFESEFRPLKHTLSGVGERALMKLVVQRSSDRVLGVHVVGHEAGEIVQGFAVAMSCGATKAQLDRTIGIHPTAAEELVTMRTPTR